MFRNFVFLVFLFCSFHSFSQCIPASNSSVNFTDIYFEENFCLNAVTYEISLSNDSTLKSGIVKSASDYPAFWLKNLEWNNNYYWHVKAFDKKGKIIQTSETHKFNTITPGVFAFDSLKITIQKNQPLKTAKGLISIDHTRSIINREGKIVWTVPEIKGLTTINSLTKDIKVTNENTITFMTDTVPVEISYQGNIIWKGPKQYVFKGDTIQYHHDFKKINDSSYIVLGNRFVYRKVLDSYSKEIIDGEPKAKMVDGVLLKKVEMSVIMEFDKKANLIWYWDANDYLKDEDLNYKKQANGFPNLSSHMNAFSVNEDGSKIYAGFRDLNRIVKIDKTSKNIECSYGEKFPSGEVKVETNLFKAQHDALITAKNTLLIINNNDAGSKTPSSVIEIRSNCSDSDTLLLWKFDFNFDNLTDGKSLKAGNVVPLPNGNYLVCEGITNRLFEVSTKKEVVWDAFLFAKMKKDKNWRPCPQYRSNWVDQLVQSHVLIKQLSDAKLIEGKIDFELELYNTGNNVDSYQVNVYYPNGGLAYTADVENMKVSDTKKVKIDINLARRNPKELKVVISSKKYLGSAKLFFVPIS